MKYTEKNYNRLKKEELYSFPSLKEMAHNKKRPRVMTKTGKVGRSSKKSLEWVEDLLAR